MIQIYSVLMCWRSICCQVSGQMANPAICFPFSCPCQALNQHPPLPSPQFQTARSSIWPHLRVLCWPVAAGLQLLGGIYRGGGIQPIVDTPLPPLEWSSQKAKAHLASITITAMGLVRFPCTWVTDRMGLKLTSRAKPAEGDLSRLGKRGPRQDCHVMSS